MWYKKRVKLYICRYHFLCKNKGVQVRCKHCTPHFHAYKDIINGKITGYCETLREMKCRDIRVECIEMEFDIRVVEKDKGR